MWAPWRMSYVKNEHAGRYEEDACVLCDLPAMGDDEAALILYRGRRSYLVLNLFPYNNGHLMAVPYDHLDSLGAVPGETRAEMMELVTRAQSVLEETMKPQGYNVGINQGAAAGAGIADHLHMHLLPRWTGDTNFMPALGDTRVIPQHIEETYALLRQGFSRRDHDPEPGQPSPMEH